MKLAAGSFDRKITLQTRRVPDPHGAPVEVWVDLATVRAQVVQRSGREFFGTDQLQAEARVIFRIRWRRGVTAQDRVVYDGRAHDIHAVIETGRKDGLELYTTTTG